MRGGSGGDESGYLVYVIVGAKVVDLVNMKSVTLSRKCECCWCNNEDLSVYVGGRASF